MGRLLLTLTTLLLSSCSAAYWTQASTSNDDLYAIHNRTEIAQREKAEAEARKAEAEARKAEWDARVAQLEAQAAEGQYNAASSSNPYAEVLADDYDSAYARRLRGFESPTYRMPSSYFNLATSDAMFYASSYDPSMYNVMLSGDQVWVEPKYVTSMFGTWGAVALNPFAYNWYCGWHSPSYYYYWGYPHYSWYDWNWTWCNWYDHTWWGLSWCPGYHYHNHYYYSHYYPYNHYWGWHGPHHHYRPTARNNNYTYGHRNYHSSPWSGSGSWRNNSGRVGYAGNSGVNQRAGVYQRPSSNVSNHNTTSRTQPVTRPAQSSATRHNTLYRGGSNGKSSTQTRSTSSSYNSSSSSSSYKSSSSSSHNNSYSNYSRSQSSSSSYHSSPSSSSSSFRSGGNHR